MSKNDESFGEASPKQTKDDALSEESFDFAAWLSGVAPAQAVYEFAGAKFTLEARTQDWIQRVIDSAKERGLSDLEESDEYLAGHIIQPRVTAADVAKMRAVAFPEVAEMTTLAQQLDTRPRSAIAPRFLPGASD